MRSEPPATLTYTETPQGRRLLVGHAKGDIPAGSVLALTRDGASDRYVLHVATPDPRDKRCPSTLASFLAPETVDEIERLHAAQMAIENTKPRRRNR